MGIERVNIAVNSRSPLLFTAQTVEVSSAVSSSISPAILSLTGSLVENIANTKPTIISTTSVTATELPTEDNQAATERVVEQESPFTTGKNYNNTNKTIILITNFIT